MLLLPLQLIHLNITGTIKAIIILLFPMLRCYHPTIKDCLDFLRRITQYTSLITMMINTCNLSVIVFMLLPMNTSMELLVNFIASFVQNLPYRPDNATNASYEYPRYPLETLKDNGGDCEDKAILTAEILQHLGYNVSLLRLPEHMAVGVHLDKNASSYQYYIGEYFYLETTNPPSILGRVPPEFIGLKNVSVYPITARPLLTHLWKNATRYTSEDGTDFVKIDMIVENLGSAAADTFEVRGGFVSQYNQTFNLESTQISQSAAGDRKEVTLKISVPHDFPTLLKTWIYFNGEIVAERESALWFP